MAGLADFVPCGFLLCEKDLGDFLVEPWTPGSKDWRPWGHWRSDHLGGRIPESGGHVRLGWEEQVLCAERRLQSGLSPASGYYLCCAQKLESRP